jgi:hypothetical protein
LSLQLHPISGAVTDMKYPAANKLLEYKAPAGVFEPIFPRCRL